MTVDCKISFDIGDFKTEDIIALMNSIHNDFIRELLSTSSVLIGRDIKIIHISDIDDYLHNIHTNREQMKDQFFHYVNFDNDEKLIYSVLNILNTEDSMHLDKQMQSDTKLILGNETLKNLCKFIIQYIFKVDLQIKISSACQKGSSKCNGWFDYENCPLYAYSLSVIIIFVIVYLCTLYIK